MKGLSFWNVTAGDFDLHAFVEPYSGVGNIGSFIAALEQLTRTGRVVKHIAFSTDDENMPWWYEGEIVLLDNMHVIFAKRAARYNKKGDIMVFDNSLVILMPGVDSAALKPSDYEVLIAALDWMAGGANEC